AMGHVRAIAAGTAAAMVERLSGAAATGAEVEQALGDPATAGHV
nr:F0F1 ATP synthase subunit B' [Caulobacteraceae bacterium]